MNEKSKALRAAGRKYTIEYTDLFGVKYLDPCRFMTRDHARSMVRYIRVESSRPMWHNGLRCNLSNVRVVESPEDYMAESV